MQDPASNDAPRETATHPAPTGPRPIDVGIEFTASGREYFRIWIIHALLILLTLSLYLPFAKARRLRYFYANTRIDGDALAFHGDPWKMLRGYALVLVVGVSYFVASTIEPIVGLGALVLLYIVWPALWRSALRFSYRNTSWRGVRFQFDGTLGQAYMANMPWLLPVLPILVYSMWMLAGPELPEEHPAHDWRLPLALLPTPFLPLATALAARYRFGKCRYADRPVKLGLPIVPFYRWGFGALLLFVSCQMALVWTFVFANDSISNVTRLLTSNSPGTVGLVTASLTYLIVVGPYSQAKIQNLVWNRVHVSNVDFTSTMRPGRFVFKNAGYSLLTLATLGLFRPFAVVANARMRLTALRLRLASDIANWQVPTSRRDPRAVGDASGDFFGLDVGL